MPVCERMSRWLHQEYNIALHAAFLLQKSSGTEETIKEIRFSEHQTSPQFESLLFW